MSTAWLSPHQDYIGDGKSVQEVSGLVFGVGLIATLKLAIKCFGKQ
jgi:hypothetical protein